MAIENPATFRLLALKAENIDAWLATVRAVLKAKLSVPQAAEALGISKRTLQTWVKNEPRLSEDLELRGPGNLTKEERAHRVAPKRKRGLAKAR